MHDVRLVESRRSKYINTSTLANRLLDRPLKRKQGERRLALSTERYGPAQKCSAEGEDGSKAEGFRVWRIAKDETHPSIPGWPEGSSKLFQRIGSSRNRHCRSRRIGARVRLRRRISDGELVRDGEYGAMRRIDAEQKVVVAWWDVFEENVERVIRRGY